MSRRKRDEELQEEMAFHRAARADHLVAQGLDRAEAERRANLEFGSQARYREECRVALGYRLYDEARGDLRYAWRGLLRTRVFSLTAIAILALAIGANTALFSLYSHFVLRPLPIRGAERHFLIQGRNAEARSTGGFTLAEAEVLRAGSAGAVEALYGSDTIQVPLMAPQQRQVLVTSVTGNYFPLLGGRPQAGRLLQAGDSTEPVAVLSDIGWRRLFGADPSAVGRTLRIRSVVFTVIGVMTREFTGTHPVTPDLWVPIGWSAAVRGRPSKEEQSYEISGLVRAGSGDAWQRASGALTSAAARLERAEPARRIAQIVVQKHRSLLPEDDQIPIVAGLLFAAFLALLLIACANLANLFLSRAGARAQEIGLRFSLGASRWRVMRQLLTESTLLALVGAAAGWGLAGLGMSQLENYLFSSLAGLGLNIPPVTVDWRVGVYAALLGVAAGCCFGLLPALEATSTNLAGLARRDSALFGGRLRPHRLRDLLLTSQVAASLVLLIAAAVLVRNIQRMDALEFGYDLDHVLDLRPDNSSRALLATVAGTPAVQGVAAAAFIPLSGGLQQLPVAAGGASRMAAVNFVDETYFDTLGVGLVAGRGFTRREADAGARVAIVSQATARRLWPGDSLGQTITMMEADGVPKSVVGSYQVIGLAPDLVSGWLFQGKDTTSIYLPAAAGSATTSSALLRVQDMSAATMARIRRACSESPAGATTCDPTPLRQVAGLQRLPFQVAASVAAVLGVLALLLTSVGLYGVVSYSIVQRRREIGVRVALGARPGQVIAAILSGAWRCVGFGLAIGLPVCLVLSKAASSTVLQIRTFDPAAYYGVPLLLAGITTAACLRPALRAARFDPMRALREE